MKLKLAKWCSIIPLFDYASCATALLIFKVLASFDIDGGEVPLVAIIGYLLVFVSRVSYLLSIFCRVHPCDSWCRVLNDSDFPKRAESNPFFDSLMR